MRFVLDASVVVGWLLGEPESFTRAKAILKTLRTAKGVVPAIWQAEVANVLVVKERQKRIDAKFLQKLVKQIQDLAPEIDVAAATGTFDRVLPLARRHQLSAYDATYLELAMREKIPLASFDKALREAALREGVELFEGA